MHYTRNLRRILAATIGSFVLLLGGCGGGEEETPVAAGTLSGSSEAVSTESTNGPAMSDAEMRPVDSETLPYAEIDERLVYGHFAFPSDMIEPLPAVVMVHDWWGLNDDTRDAANQLASYGYMVLAVDLYFGDTVDSVDDARRRTIPVMENPQHVEANIKQALQFLEIAGAPKSATLGWGFGGRWSLNAAMWFPEHTDAAVVYYGQVTSDEEILELIDAPVLGLFGERDRSVTAETVAAFEEAMQRLGKELSIHSYPRTGHAFADPARATYDAETAADAWRRTEVFLAAALAPDEED